MDILEFLKLKNRANVFLKIDRKHVKNDFKNDAVDLSENGDVVHCLSDIIRKIKITIHPLHMSILYGISLVLNELDFSAYSWVFNNVKSFSNIKNKFQ